MDSGWTGPGKWLPIGGGVLLLVTGTLQLITFQRALASIAGWNIFLGLLVLGALLSSSRKASGIVTTVAVLTGLRLVLALVLRPLTIDLGIDVLLFMLFAAGAYDLRQQAKAVQA